MPGVFGRSCFKTLAVNVVSDLFILCVCVGGGGGGGGGQSPPGL